jgi:hypothetical protein
VDSVALMVAEKETLLKERRELEQSLSKYAWGLASAYVLMRRIDEEDPTEALIASKEKEKYVLLYTRLSLSNTPGIWILLRRRILSFEKGASC